MVDTPRKEWMRWSCKPTYPTIGKTYNVLCNIPPIEGERERQYIIDTKEGRLYIWENQLVILANIAGRHDFKEDFKVVFETPDGKRWTVKEVEEAL